VTDQAVESAGITLVLPALNEEGAIVGIIEHARRVFEAHQLGPYEIIVVNDGSSDCTGELATSAGARVIPHPITAGYGKSLKDGIEAAQYDTIVISDADGTYPLERIPDLVARYRAGFDMLVGAREGKHLNQTVMKTPLRMILKFLVEYSVGRPVPDVNSGLRVFCRKTVIPYFPHICDTFSFTTSLTLAYLLTGRFVGYIPIKYAGRIGQSKVKLFRESLRTLQYIVQGIAYYNPLKLFLLFSFILLLGAGVVTALAIVWHVKSGFVLAIGLILMALLVFALGLLADLLRQILAKP
jgi:glycosyltransferase involved in cell wall biosynthesis